jgi:hypothetical protein
MSDPGSLVGLGYVLPASGEDNPHGTAGESV